MGEILKIRPYARLITMLGDQLIKNDLIALVELIKNSYDADASFVKIIFKDFNEDYSINPKSQIIIQDDGCGMDKDIIQNHWLNPATPEKLKRKKQKSVTPKGRIMQGEKGIGRFAIFKLGSKISITTRRQINDNEGALIESVVIYDFSQYDQDFLREGEVEKDLFLEDLKVQYYEQSPQTNTNSQINLGSKIIRRKPFGTQIVIENLKNNWSSNRIERIQSEIGKLQPIFLETTVPDFAVWVYENDAPHFSQDHYKDRLINCLSMKSVFRITNGLYNEQAKSISMEINSQRVQLFFSDAEIKGIKQFRSYFETSDYETECGNFKFEFYIFDLTASEGRYVLDDSDKKIIRDHRIYLYRDGIRVLPYGDPEDDWLGTDVARGTISASQFLSNDQVVGCVYISQRDNPKLKDKTNREGLIEEGKALEDFVKVLQVILRYLRSNIYAKYLIDKQRRQQADDFKQGKPLGLIEDAKKQFTDEKGQKFLNAFEKSYRQERKILLERINKTENLAAVGLSIDAASHDVMLFLKKALEQLESLIKDLAIGGEINQDLLCNEMILLRGNLSMVETQMKDIQLLFPSTKSKTKRINIKDILEKVNRIYKRACSDNNIDVNIELASASPLVVKTTDAVLLQVFINLFDNALYWLKTSDTEREILITIDSSQQRVIFSDNGPGIKEEDANYIFDAFYSAKGEDGRGLGLYIARQLLERYDYTIELAEFSKDKLLSGANFVLEFAKEE